MTIKAILTEPNKILRQVSKPVTKVGKEEQNLMDDMIETMYSANGIGLAANQIGLLKRIVTIKIPYTKEDRSNQVCKRWWHDQAFTFINPVLVRCSNKKTRAFEGCLSFPDVFDYVPRVSEVTVKAFNEFGKEFVVEADGLFAICLQHEIDHLNGILFIDYLSKLKKDMIIKKLIKHKKKDIERIVV